MLRLNQTATNHRTKSPQITEQNHHKSPNKIATNHRTKSPQITEKFVKYLHNWVKTNIFAPKITMIWQNTSNE